MACSGQIEAIGVHHLAPRSDEVADKLLPVVILGINLGTGTKDGVGAEDQINAGRGPPEGIRSLRSRIS